MFYRQLERHWKDIGFWISDEPVQPVRIFVGVSNNIKGDSDGHLG